MGMSEIDYSRCKNCYGRIKTIMIKGKKVWHHEWTALIKCDSRITEAEPID